MKNRYEAPEAQLIRLDQDEVLAASGNNPLIDQSQNSSGSAAENFGGVDLW